jgi:hypothetical protein
MNCKNEILKGVCFGIGQSIAGVLFLTFFGKKIYKYVVDSVNEMEQRQEKVEDLNMQQMYNDTIKEKDVNSDECLLSDGETIKIKQKISLNRF